MPDVVIPPAGVTPLGFFSPVEHVSPAKPPSILADDIDPMTGKLRSWLKGVHPVDAHVVTIARGVRGSGAVLRAIGNTVPSITQVDETIESRVKGEVERSFALLVDRGDIRIDKIIVEELGGQGDGVTWFMGYTNLRTRRPEKVPLL